MKKNVLVFVGFAILAFSLASCGSSKTNDNNPAETIYYQCDTMLTLSATGDTLWLQTQKFDTKGQVIYVFDKQRETTNYWTQEFDDLGRIIKTHNYEFQDGKWVETSTYTVEYKDTLKIATSVKTDGIQRDSIYMDANGREIRFDSYFALKAGDEFVPNYCCDYSYDEHGNVTLKHYSDPNDSTYIIDQKYQYTYAQFGELTQYTSVVFSHNEYTLEKTDYEYDKYGNNIRTSYYKYNQDGESKLFEVYELEVDTTILSSRTYGLNLVPQQPHIYKGKSKFFDAEGNLLRTKENFFSIHHIEK